MYRFLLNSFVALVIRSPFPTQRQKRVPSFRNIFSRATGGSKNILQCCSGRNEVHNIQLLNSFKIKNWLLTL